MIEILEIGAVILGCYLLWREVIIQRFKNFATSVFLICYVPLFCVYPVIGRLLAGGAISVHTSVHTVFEDIYVYLIFQAYNFALLLGFLILSSQRVPQNAVNKQPSASISVSTCLPALTVLLCFGVFLYVYSTGYSVTELLVASRFEWFLNDNYSPFLAVVASYFVALTPVVVYIAAKEDHRGFVLFFVIVLLVFYGVLSKDRKWLIFIISGLMAARYYKYGGQIRITRNDVLMLVVLGSVLAFWQIARGVFFDAFVTGAQDVAMNTKHMAVQLLTMGDLPYYYNASVTAIHMNFNEGFSIPLGLVRRQLLFFLPVDYSFNLKIEDISAIFSDAIEGGDNIRRGNMPPGLIGLFVLSFEWWGGVFLLSMLPIILKMVDIFIRRRNGILQIAMLSYLFSSTLLFLRGDDSSATYFPIFSIMVLFLLCLPRAIRNGLKLDRLVERIQRAPK